MYKMIVVDLDGTLLNDYKQVSKENKEMIKKAYTEKGVITVIATGRPLSYAKQICGLGSEAFTDYIISCNGAIIKNIKTNEDINKNMFTNNEILDIRKIAIDEKANYMMIYTEEEALIEVSEDIEFEKSGVTLSQEQLLGETIEEAIIKNPEKDKFLCLIGGEEANLERIIKALEKFPELEPFIICNYLHKTEEGIFESKYIDVVKKGSTKKNAIYILAEKLNIKKEEIIVMGDGGNDIPMFESAGLKVAMANAEDYIKEMADYITVSNNESGVAKAIQKFIFDEE